jgi:hypothetical protein
VQFKMKNCKEKDPSGGLNISKMIAFFGAKE